MKTTTFKTTIDKSAKKDILARLLAEKPHVRLEVDEKGRAVVDKEKHPRLYDWAVNG